MRLAGHSWGSKNELVSDVLLWNPPHGKRGVGGLEKTYVDQLADDAGFSIEDLPCLLEDRDVAGYCRESSRQYLDQMNEFDVPTVRRSNSSMYQLFDNFVEVVGL